MTRSASSLDPFLSVVRPTDRPGAPPRYACYPTTAQFDEAIGADQAEAWAAALPPGARISLRAHVPFCERLCWFCSSRTQRAAGRAPLDAFLAGLAAEARRLGALLPAGAQVVELRWTGGSPTLLDAEQMAALDRDLRAALPVARDARFAVELEAQGLAPDRLAALVGLGLGEAAIGLQDFDPRVQAMIGRETAVGQVVDLVVELRRAGVARIAIDLLYGLPEQTEASFAAACAVVALLGPEAVTLSGYAHMPWVAKRQRMIPEAALPDAAARRAQFAAGAERLKAAGYVPCGAELFLRPSDALAAAFAAGRLRRDLAGYGAEPAIDAAIGLGPAAVSRYPQGYVQNLAETGRYLDRVASGRGAGARGRAFRPEDRLRGRAIEAVLCGFRVDLAALRDEFGDLAETLAEPCAAAARAFPGAVTAGPWGVAVDPAAPLVAPRVAEFFDAFAAP